MNANKCTKGLLIMITNKLKKSPLMGVCFLATIAITSTSAHAGGRHSYNDGPGFFLFDLFGQAPQSKYRKPSPQVRGFNRKVGGYSYKFEDTLPPLGSKPDDFSPIFDRGLFSDRLGPDGPYIGD